MSEPRMFLMLQGPMGSFFKKLGAALRRNGHRTLRVNFNGGDRLHFSSRYAIDFLGTLEQWPEAVEKLAQQHGVTDLVLYGDCRPLHQIAIAALKPRGIRIHVFEEGYFRPEWITLEEGGVNGYSPLPRDADFYRNYSHEVPNYPPLPGGRFWRIIRHTIGYYTASALLLPRYRHYRTHRPRTYQKEGFAWIWRLTEIYLTKGIVRRRKRHVLTGQRPYFLILLQLLGDSQITHHSPYHDMYEFLNEVLNNFAQNAPPETILVVKNHPLDNGLTRYRSFLQQKSRSLGLAGRLVFVDGGHLPSLLQKARGAVTVNSTAGLSAIHHGIPTYTMGTAVYAIDGLVSRQPLAEFWHQPAKPDMELYKSFRQYVLRHAQISGGFYRPSAIRRTIALSMPRLLALPAAASSAITRA